MAGSTNNALYLIRGIVGEFRKSLPGKPLKQHVAVRYMLSEARRHQVTEERVCQAHLELQHRAATYLCYLGSTRRSQEIEKQYHGRGERSVEESARLVGLGLPKPYSKDK